MTKTNEITLKGFTPRIYQETILGTCSLKNSLVVLPTGLGKTGIALLLSVQRLKTHPDSKVVFLAPTKPLVEQHKKTFLEHLDLPESQLQVFTGEITPVKRAMLWKYARIIFSTPQGLENDIINGNVDLSNISLMIFDEAHRAVGNYSYVFIAKQFMKKANFPRILALTASPGSDILTIEDVCQNLFIESVEVRTDDDPDVAPYVQETDVNWVKVSLSGELKKVKKLLEQCVKERYSQLKRLGINRVVTKKDLLAQQARLRVLMSKRERSVEVFRGLSVLAEVFKIQHAQELIETQSLNAVVSYFDRLFNDAVTSKVKAVKNVCADPLFKSAFHLSSELLKKGIEHPKIDKIKELVNRLFSENSAGKIIIFTQFRDTAVKIKDVLDSVVDCKSAVFVGQAKKNGTGLSQKEQKEVLDLFRDGEFNCLIATSVAEEGLDIPSVDNVIFFEPIPSAIRTIQRRGRTGRHDKGNVFVLVTKDTRDEAYRHVARYKEKNMNNVLYNLKRHFALKKPEPKKLDELNKNILILVDYREKGSGVVKSLISKGVNIKLEMLDSADFIVSHSCGVEFKTVKDFVSSIIDGRIFDQARRLKQKFEKPIIIVEGKEDIYSVRNIHPNAVRGLLASLVVGFGIPVLQTKDAEDSAAMLISLASREQKKDSDFNIHFSKPQSAAELQEFIVSSLPGIGPQLAKELLSEFGSVKAVFTAEAGDLKKVKGIGDKTVQNIKDLIEKKYQKD